MRASFFLCAIALLIANTSSHAGNCGNIDSVKVKGVGFDETAQKNKGKTKKLYALDDRSSESNVWGYDIFTESGSDNIYREAYSNLRFSPEGRFVFFQQVYKVNENALPTKQDFLSNLREKFGEPCTVGESRFPSSTFNPVSLCWGNCTLSANQQTAWGYSSYNSLCNNNSRCLIVDAEIEGGKVNKFSSMLVDKPEEISAEVRLRELQAAIRRNRSKKSVGESF